MLFPCFQRTGGRWLPLVLMVPPARSLKLVHLLPPQPAEFRLPAVFVSLLALFSRHGDRTPSHAGSIVISVVARFLSTMTGNTTNSAHSSESSHIYPKSFKASKITFSAPAALSRSIGLLRYIWIVTLTR